MSKYYFLFVFLLVGITAKAQKMYGGHFDRRSVTGALFGQPFAYRFACTFYADAAGATALPAQLRFRIVSKKDNRVVKEYTAAKDQDTQGTGAINECVAVGAKSRLDYLFVRYNHDMIVNPTEFNEAEGYYVVNDPVGPRNPSANVASSNVVLYHWFSPQYLFEQLDNANEGRTASVWIPQTYFFACRNQDNSIPIGLGMLTAQSLVNQQTFNLTLKNAIPLTDGTLPFREVAWNTGFSNTNIGLGNSLRIINANPTFSNGSGTSNVTAAFMPPQSGVFTVAYLTEHRRNGALIAVNYREFQIEVTDCLKTVANYAPTVSEVGSPQTQLSATFCSGSRIQINADAGVARANYEYQWFKNGQKIAAETKVSLVVSETGSYHAELHLKGACNTVTMNPIYALAQNCQNNAGNATILGSTFTGYGTSSDGGMFIRPFWNNYAFRASYYVPMNDILRMPQTIKATIYQKNNNQRMDEIILRRYGSSESTQFLQRACGTAKDTIQSIGYDGNLEVALPKYGSPDGYYIITEPICCRAKADNIAQNDTKVVNYLEVGGADRIEWNGVSGKGPLPNSYIPSRMQACVGQEFSVFIGADNTQNLTAKIVGFSQPLIDAPGIPVFRALDWKTGFGTDNFAGNSLPFRLENGQLRGTPEKPGVYVYRIQIDGIMNGAVFSRIFNEFRIEVKDCRMPPQPTIFVSKVGKPTIMSVSAICEDSLVQLNLRNFAKSSSFQWTLGGINIIANAKDSIFIVRNNQPGMYSCVVTNLQLCPETMTAMPVTITFVPKPTVSVSAATPTGMPCQDGFVRLTSNVSGPSPILYQWQREFQPIMGGNMSSFDAIDTGVYLLKVTDSNGCSNISGSVNVISNTPPKIEISVSKGGFCKGEQVIITATPGRTYLYQWLRNGQPIGGGSNRLSVSLAGVYTVKVTATNGCTVETLPLTIVEYKDPIVNISNTGTQLCAGAVLMLTANGEKLKKYQWLRDGQSIANDTNKVLNVKQAGTYSVAVSDSNGCRASSSPTAIEIVAKVTVMLDSVPNFCGTTFPAVALKGTPAGGVYTGNGVVNATFDPKIAGVGEHTLTYSVKGNLDCLNGESKRIVNVSKPPVLDLGANKQLFRGSSLVLGIDLGNDYTYAWTPPTGINTPNIARPVFTPQQTTTYSVLAKSNTGCVISDSIRIEVFAGLYIPDVFTPNNDNQNDTWLLEGLNEYPEAEVTIFDRWGRIIFQNKGAYSKPFDGTLDGFLLPSAVYVYVIRTQKDGHVFRGQVLLLR